MVGRHAAAEAQDDDPVGRVEHGLEVVADEDDAESLAAHLPDQLQHLGGLGHAVEGANDSAEAARAQLAAKEEVGDDVELSASARSW
jgi:hypothetical protein